MKILRYNNINFYNNLNQILDKRNSTTDKKLEENVKKIINEVKKKGDEALIKYSKKFDKIKVTKNSFKLSNTLINKKIKVDKNVLDSFKKAIKNINKFHKKQLPKDIIQNENNK